MLNAPSSWLQNDGTLHNVQNLTAVPAAKDWQVMYAHAGTANFTTPVFSEDNIGHFSIMKITFMSSGNGHFSMKLGVAGGANGELHMDGVMVVNNNSLASYSKSVTNSNGWFELSGNNSPINAVMQMCNAGGGSWGGRFHGMYGINNFFDGALKWEKDIRFTWTGSGSDHKAAIRVEVAA